MLSPLSERPVSPSTTSSKAAHACDYLPPPALVPAQYPQVGGQLQEFHQALAAWGASAWILSILQEGYQQEFQKPPTPFFFAPGITSPTNPANIEIFWEQTDTLLAKGALEPVTPSPGPGFFFPKKS